MVVAFEPQDHQKEAFNGFFAEIQSKYIGLLGDGFISYVSCLRLIDLRMTMIFLKMATTLDIKEKKAESYTTALVKKRLLHPPKQDHYIKMISRKFRLNYN